MGGRWKKYLPAAAMAVCIVLFFLFGRDVDAETLSRFAPDNPWLAALFLTAAYALKSQTLFFPLVALYLAGGLLFPTPAALLVNLLGVTACIAVPYAAGRLSAADTLARLKEKYPKLQAVERMRRKSNVLFAALLRAVGFLPGDVVSLYLGAARMPFGPYVLGSLAGLAPTLIAVTILGGGGLRSPAFWIAAACNAVTIAASLLASRKLLQQ